MPPLDRAFALVQIKDIAVLVAEDLDLDMARVQDEFLDENAIVAEAVEAFALDALEPPAAVLFVIGNAHALAAAAGGTRKSVDEGKRVSVRLDLGGRPVLQKKNKSNNKRK